jgi:hypothetical protein
MLVLIGLLSREDFAVENATKPKDWEEWVRIYDGALASWWWIIRGIKCRRNPDLLAEEISTVVRSGGKWGGTA